MYRRAIVVFLPFLLALAAVLLSSVPLDVAAQPAARPGEEGRSLCPMLGAVELEPLVGAIAGTAGVVTSRIHGTCNWGRYGENNSLTASYYDPDVGPQKMMAFLRDQSAAQKGAVVKDEAGIGAGGFSAVYPQQGHFEHYGAEFQVIKNGHLIMLSYTTEAPGTEHMRDLLRVAARKLAGQF